MFSEFKRKNYVQNKYYRCCVDETSNVLKQHVPGWQARSSPASEKQPDKLIRG